MQKLRKLDSIIKPDKGAITKEITQMHRRIVKQSDDNGRMIPKEYLTVQGYFHGYNFTGEKMGQEFVEGVCKKPIMGKMYHDLKRFNPETGEDLGKIDVQKIVDNYYIEVPKDTAKRKKLIDSIIESANGTYPENIRYYYMDTEAGYRDSSFSYEQFTDSSIEELRDLSKRGGGAKGSPYYRDKDNVLRHSDSDSIVSLK